MIERKVENDINNVKTRRTKNSKANLTKEDKASMEERAKRADIIIENAEKGRTIVIMNTYDYINESNCELSDKYIYKQLRKDPTLKHDENVDNTERFQGENLLLEKAAESLKIFNWKTPKFFMTPEIDKENNPKRFTTNSINCHTSEILRFSDHYLQLVLQEIPSYIKGTNDFFKRIND